MVKLNRIYTRTGDDGTTGLGTGARVSKASARVDAYGVVDEANACIGVAVTLAGDSQRIRDVLVACQHDLFDLGADLCTPVAPGEAPGQRLRIVPAQTKRLESQIDEFNERLAPLTSFVLPGGSPLSAALHVARTVARRAERLTVALVQVESEATNPETVRYLNRLSDLLFVLGRSANAWGVEDVLWVPGVNRPR